MKKLLPLILLAFPTASFADITHSIQSVASVSTLGASATSERIGSSISVSGTNIQPKANTVANQIGSLDLADADEGKSKDLLVIKEKLDHLEVMR